MYRTDSLNKVLAYVDELVTMQERALHSGSLKDLSEYKAACKLRTSLKNLRLKIEEIIKNNDND